MLKNAFGYGRLLAVAIAAALGSLLFGCGSLPNGSGSGADSAFDLHGLKIRAPEGKGWQHIEDQDGQHFVMLRDGLADYAVLYSVTTPSNRRLTSLEQLFARLNTDPALEYESLDMGIVEGTPVIRFSLHEEDDGAAYELIRQRLQLDPRPDYPKYYTSTRGFMLLHPDDPGNFVTVACARTSYHGFIGSHFEEISESFFNAFVKENFRPHAGESVEIGQMAGSPTAALSFEDQPADLFD